VHESEIVHLPTRSSKKQLRFILYELSNGEEHTFHVIEEFLFGVTVTP
jgi:hypothetical protein